MKITLAILVLFVFYGCIQTKQLAFNNTWQLVPYSIALSPECSDFYEQGWNLYHDGSSAYYVAYNRKTHALDWFDLDKQQLFHRSRLERQGPNQVLDMVHGIYVHTPDSVFLADGAYLYVVDMDGRVKNRIRNAFDTEAGSLTMVPGSSSMLAYNSRNKSLIGRAFTPAGSQLIFLEVELQTGEVTLHHAPVSECYGRMARMRHDINVSFRGDSIIYNPSCCADIFVYEMNGGTTTRFEGESALSQNRVSDPVSEHPDASWRHFIENPKFFQVVYSPADRRYYRMHWKEHDSPDDSDIYLAAYEKPVIMTVFDENFRLIPESELAARQYLMGFLVPTSRGVLLNANNPSHPEYDVDHKELHLWEVIH